MLIIASINPTTSDDQLKKIIIAGPDALRFNFFYYSIEKNIEYITKARQTIENLNSSIKELIDFPLNKIRLGEFDGDIFAVRENEEFVFRSGPYSPDCNQFVPVNTQKLGSQIHINQTISLGNGRISLQVVEIRDEDNAVLKVLNNGVIKTMQEFNNGTCIDDSETLKTYKLILHNIKQLEPDFIAISYVNEGFIGQIKQLPIFEEIKNRTKIIIKIEKEISDAELEKICQDRTFGMLLIDRGEIGVNMPFERCGIYQKKVMNIARKFNKPVLISTQTLVSTIDNYIPTRSEISDLTNIILDGAAGIILSKETNSGRRPVYAISVAKKIIDEVEKHKDAFAPRSNK